MAINETLSVYGTESDIAVKRAIGGKVARTYGINYPLGKTLENGFFGKSSGTTLIVNGIKQLLGTERGERVNVPDFGVSLLQYLFEPLDDITITAIEKEIRDALLEWGPKVQILDLRVYNTDDYNLQGIQAIQIELTMKVKDGLDTVVTIPVRIG